MHNRRNHNNYYYDNYDYCCAWRSHYGNYSPAASSFRR